jgi:hypothetical protein
MDVAEDHELMVPLDVKSEEAAAIVKSQDGLFLSIIQYMETRKRPQDHGSFGCMTYLPVYLFLKLHHRQPHTF